MGARALTSQAGEILIVVDNLVNSDSESLNRVRELTSCAEEALQFRNVDLCDAKVSSSFFHAFESHYDSAASHKK